jgi:hypothetical protein
MAVTFALRRKDVRRARRLDSAHEFRNPDFGILFGEVCLVFLQRMRALIEVVVE